MINPILRACCKNKNGIPAFAGMTVIFEGASQKNTVMPAKAGIPFVYLFVQMEKE
jgi:hypothetical protein